MVLWPVLVRSVNNFDVDMIIHMLFIHTIYSGYSFRRSIHGAGSKANFSFEKCWKLCQKMRLDALIIFPIEWSHNIVILIGKRSKYCRGFFWYKDRKDVPRRADQIFPIERHHHIVILIRKRSKYCKLSFMSAIHAGYPCRPSLQPIHSGYASETDH